MARKSKARKARKPVDAITLLKQDHASVKKSFKQFEKIGYKDPNARVQFLAALCEELKVHTALEEEIFYPAVRAKIKDDDLMNEALIEHRSAKDLIRELEGMKGNDPMLEATVTVLSEYIQHHVREEESEMFPKLKRLKLDLPGLAEQMLARREELKRE
jgi:hemerythrin-like domain-containing protein